MTSWKELWRPFLEVDPHHLTSIKEIIFNGILLPLANEENESICVRALKLFAHYCMDKTLVEELFTNPQIFTPIYEKILKCTSNEEPYLRQNSLLVLCSLVSQSIFFTWIMEDSDSINQISKLTNISLHKLQDPAIQVSELAIEFLTRWITVGCFKNPEKYLKWKEKVIENQQIGQQLFRMFEQTNILSTQIVLTNLIIELTCPIENKNEDKNHLEKEQHKLRNYYRGRIFVHQYHLASSALFYINSKDKILRFRVVEMLQSLTQHQFHFLLLPEDMITNNDNKIENCNDIDTETQIIEQKFLKILEILIWSHQSNLSYNNLNMVILYAQLSSALSFKFKLSSMECIFNFFVPSLAYLLSILFNFNTSESTKIFQSKICYKTQIKHSVRDVISLSTLVIDSLAKISLNHGNQFLNNNEFIKTWENSFFKQKFSLNNENLDHWVHFLVSNENNIDILDIVIACLNHPNLCDKTSFVFSGIHAIEKLISQNPIPIKWKKSQILYHFDSNILLDISSNELNEDLIQSLIHLLSNENTPAAVLSKIYKLFSNCIEKLLLDDFSNSNFIYNILKNIYDILPIQLFHPIWEHNDSAIQFIGFLLNSSKSNCLISMMNEIGFLNILFQGLNVSNRYVRASSLSVIGDMCVCTFISIEKIFDLFNTLKNNLPVMKELCKNFYNDIDFISFIISSAFDDEEIFKREFVILLSKLICNFEWLQYLVKFCLCDEQLKLFKDAMNVVVLQDGDWEVKKSAINLLGLLWQGFNRMDIQHIKLCHQLAVMISADSLLFEAVSSKNVNF